MKQTNFETVLKLEKYFLLKQPIHPAMDDISTSDTPEPLLVGPPLPQEPPTNKPSLQDVLFGFSSEHKFEHDDQESLASLDDPVPIPAMHPVEPPREISMGKQDLISISGDTFYEDRSLEARIHRSLKHTPTCDAIAKMNPKRQMPQQKAEISREAKLERTLEQMRNELKESQDRISDLQTENKILHEECQRLQLRLAQKDDTSGKILRQEVERLQRSVKNLTTQKNQYQAEAKSMTLAKSATEEERTRMVTTWQIAERDANDAQIECSKLRKELETSQNESVEAKRSKSMMEEQLMDLRKHNKLLDEKILAESITSRATVAEIQLKLDKKESGCKEMQTKVHELSMHLEAKSKACSALMTKKAQLEERLKRPLLHHQEVQTDVITWTNPETFTHSDRALSLKRPHPVSTAARPISSDSMLPPKISPTFDSTDGNSLSDRLIRIRESAEKASLIREHQRDMSRLQSEHAAQIASQQQEFNEESGRMAEESLAELNHRIKELKRRLVTEYEKKLDELERKHKKELQRVSHAAWCSSTSYWINLMF